MHLVLDLAKLLSLDPPILAARASTIDRIIPAQTAH